MKERKRQYMGIYANAYYDRTGISRHLEKMAARGWMLDHIGSGVWHYRRTEPKKLRFSVVYFPAASQFDPEPTEELATFRDYCAAAGWQLAADTAQMQIFYNEQEDPVPIETDPAVELKNLRRSLRRSFLPAYGFLLLEALLCSSLRVSKQMLLLLLAILAYMGVMLLLVHTASSAMRHLRFRAWVNRLVSVGMILALTVGMFAGMIAWIFYSDGRLDGSQPAEAYEYMGWTWQIYHDDIPLRLEDLIETDYDRWSTEARREGSVLLSRTKYSQQARIEDKDEPELTYTVVRVKIPALYDFVEQALRRQAERFNDPDLPEFWSTYQSVDPTSWGIPRVYQRFRDHSPTNRYLLCFEDRFAEVTFDHAWTVTEAQMSITAEALKNA